MCASWARTPSETPRAVASPMGSAATPSNGLAAATEMRMNYAHALYNDDDPTLDDIREAVGTLEEIERTARRVLGGAHPLTGSIERHRRKARATLLRRACDETSPGRK